MTNQVKKGYSIADAPEESRGASTGTLIHFGPGGGGKKHFAGSSSTQGRERKKGKPSGGGSPENEASDFLKVGGKKKLKCKEREKKGTEHDRGGPCGLCARI